PYRGRGTGGELQGVRNRALLRPTGSALTPASLPAARGGAGGPAAPPPAGAAGFLFEPFLRQRLEAGTTDLYAEAHRQLDRILLPLVHEFSGGNQRTTARFLSIARNTFRVKLREAGLSSKRSLEDGEDDKE